MEKIKLNNGTTLEIQSGATEDLIKIVALSIDEVIAYFTDENLSQIEFLTEAGDVSAIYTKKHLKKFSAEVIENGYLLFVILEDVNELYERIKVLEATVETLLAEKENTEEIVETEIIEEEE